MFTARYKLNVCNSDTSASWCMDTVVLTREPSPSARIPAAPVFTYTAESFIAHTTEDTCICSAFTAVKS